MSWGSYYGIKRTDECSQILHQQDTLNHPKTFQPLIHLNLRALAQDLNHLLGALIDAEDQFFLVLFGLSWIECDGYVHEASRRENLRLEAHLQEGGVCERTVHTAEGTENANSLCILNLNILIKTYIHTNIFKSRVMH